MCGCPTHGRVGDATIPLVTISTMDGGRMVSRSTSVPHPWPVAASPAYLRPATRPRMGHPHAPRGQGPVFCDDRSLRTARNPRRHPQRVRRKNKGCRIQTIHPRRPTTRPGPLIPFPPYYLNLHPPSRIGGSKLHSLVTASTRRRHESLRIMSARVARQVVGSLHQGPWIRARARRFHSPETRLRISKIRRSSSAASSFFPSRSRRLLNCPMAISV